MEIRGYYLNLFLKIKLLTKTLLPKRYPIKPETLDPPERD